MILNKDFINLFTITKDKNLFKPIPFKLFNNLIIIQSQYENELLCKIDNNIISKHSESNLINNQMNNQNNNIYTKEYLKHLIRTIYFKKEYRIINLKIILLKYI